MRTGQLDAELWDPVHSSKAVLSVIQAAALKEDNPCSPKQQIYSIPVPRLSLPRVHAMSRQRAFNMKKARSVSCI